MENEKDEKDEQVSEKEEEEEETLHEEHRAKLQKIVSEPIAPPPTLNVFLTSGLFELLFGLSTFIGLTLFTSSVVPNASKDIDLSTIGIASLLPMI